MSLGSPRSPAAANRARRAAAWLLTAASVVYNDWLLQFVLPTGLDQRDSYVSELFAADQPHRILFRCIELACAILMIGAAFLARGALSQPLAVVGWTAVGAMGLFSVTDVLMPMRCAPSVQPGCTAVSLWHAATSGAVHLALFASMALFIAASHRHAPSWPLVHRWGPWLLPASMAAAIATVGPFFGHPGGQGIAQRIHLVSVGAWFVLLAAELFRTCPTPRTAPTGAAERGPQDRPVDGAVELDDLA
ncbi:DUF998 domain-containing protein [Streptomyces sp. NPDC048483]|uniref:DUF998 domain-containing protein n=1 Tax=Streptomyces sp. NPDC048483 TaxID=3154927 RepID=UPI003417AE3E